MEKGVSSQDESDGSRTRSMPQLWQRRYRQTWSVAGRQRYKCPNAECSRCTFIRGYRYRGYLPEVKQQIAGIALNGSGIRDTACVLKISSTTVIETLKSPQLKAVIEARLLELEPTQTVVCLCQWEAIKAELDEM